MTTQIKTDNNAHPNAYAASRNIDEKKTNTGTSIVDNAVIAAKHEQQSQLIFNDAKIVDELGEINDAETLVDTAKIVFTEGKKDLQEVVSSNAIDETTKDAAENGLNVIENGLAFLANIQQLNHKEVATHAETLNLNAKAVLSNIENNSSSIKKNAENDSSSINIDALNLLVLSAIIAVKMMQISQVSARLLSISSESLNISLNQQGQVQQFFAKLSSIYKSALNQVNKKEAEDKTTPSTQINFSTAMKYEGQGGNLVLSADEMPELFQKYATAVGNKSYSISPAGIKSVMGFVAQKLALVLPSKDKADISSAFDDSITLDSALGIIANQIKMLNDLTSSLSNQISINQNNAQAPANDFKQYLNVFMQTTSSITR